MTTPSRTLFRKAESLLANRRNFIMAGMSLSILPLLGRITFGAVQRNPRFDVDPFQLGIACGDPSPDGFVLWTRLCPQPLEGGGLPPDMYEVTWEIGDDEGMRRIVQKGTTIATPQLGHSVHVEPTGLQPDRSYWYRFRCGSAESPIGRARTTPLPNVMVERLRFAFASCQHYEYGYYTAYEHMAKEPLDLIVHLGDYIYEYKSTDNRPRRHNSDELNSLESYRNRYAQYKLDPLLKAAHALCPWLVVWDDHEFDNNYAGLISEERNIDPAAFATRRANAYQAFYEHLPMRSSCLPKGPDAQIYRRITYGQLINFEMLDTRQYRTDQPNGDGNKPITDDVLRPDATLLGDAQERWLMSELLQSTSQWNVLAQQVLMARVDRTAGTNRNFSMDQWAGYDAARTRLLRFISERKIPNPIVLTGDIHSNWANDLKIDFDRPEEPTVATEFAGTSISSGGNGAESPATLSQTLSENPFVHFHNTERGYVSCEVTPEAWHTHYRTVPYIAQPGAPLQTRRSFTVENGKPGITS